MQFHTCVCVLVCLHAYVNMLPVMCDGVLPTYCTHVLHEGLHTHMCYSSGYKLATHVCMCYSHVCVYIHKINVNTFYKTFMIIIMYINEQNLA